MNTYTEKTLENKNQPAANGLAKMQRGGESVFQFADNRSEAVTQKKLQEMADNSPRMKPLRAFQEMADNSSQAKQTAQLQVMADNYTAQQHQCIQKKENNTGLPDNLKTGIENLSGMSLDAVKVHYNSDKPAQLYAHAYAQGTDIHLGPGQEKHLPHEAWHTVQQMQGRVQATLMAKGVTINDDPALEREADLMGEKAATQKRLNRFPPLQEKSVTNEGGFKSLSAAPVQRSVGLEIESTPSWQAYDSRFGAILGAHVTLYKTPHFRLETELSGKLEFVIEPPCNTTQELINVMYEVVAIARKIESAPIPKKHSNVVVRDDFASAHFKEERRKNVDLFLLSNVVDGAAEGIYISKGFGSFHGGFQATVGVHLSTVPFLMERLAKGDLSTTGGQYPSTREISAAINTAENTRRTSTDMPYARFYPGISPELEGLLNLIYYYIFVGTAKEKRPFPKGMTQVMARTNFGQMFSMTREAMIFKTHPDMWVKLVCGNARIDPARPVFCGTFGDNEEANQSVDITIGDWLVGMTKGTDVLSVKGGGPVVLKTMGDLQKTDDLGGKDQNDRGVIIELRGLDTQTKPINQWVRFAYEISCMIEQLNSRVQDSNQARKDVLSKGAGLRWGSKEYDDVNAMAIEAMYSTFNSQIVGLIRRAKERAAYVNL